MLLPVKQCPYCGGTEFVVGYQHHEAMITYTQNGFFGNRVRHTICKQCGSIVHSMVPRTEKYKQIQPE